MTSLERIHLSGRLATEADTILLWLDLNPGKLPAKREESLRRHANLMNEADLGLWKQHRQMEQMMVEIKRLRLEADALRKRFDKLAETIL